MEWQARRSHVLKIATGDESRILGEFCESAQRSFGQKVFQQLFRLWNLPREWLRRMPIQEDFSRCKNLQQEFEPEQGEPQFEAIT